MSTNQTPSAADSVSALTDGLSPVAWALTAFGRVQKIVIRADVADELACKWRESDPGATAVPLYTAEQMRQAVAPMAAELAKVNNEFGSETADWPDAWRRVAELKERAGCLWRENETLRAALAVVVRDWTEQFERNGHLAPAWVKQAREALGPSANYPAADNRR